MIKQSFSHMIYGFYVYMLMLHCNYLFENASVCLVMWVLWEDVGLVGRKESNEAKILAMRETGFLKIVYRPASN